MRLFAHFGCVSRVLMFWFCWGRARSLGLVPFWPRRSRPCEIVFASYLRLNPSQVVWQIFQWASWFVSYPDQLSGTLLRTVRFSNHALYRPWTDFLNEWWAFIAYFSVTKWGIYIPFISLIPDNSHCWVLTLNKASHSSGLAFPYLWNWDEVPASQSS